MYRDASSVSPVSFQERCASHWYPPDRTDCTLLVVARRNAWSAPRTSRRARASMPRETSVVWAWPTCANANSGTMMKRRAVVIASAGRPLLETRQLIGGHAVHVLRRWVPVRPNVGRIGGDRVGHRVGNGGVLLHEPGRLRFRSADDVVEHQYLPVRRRPRADADHRNVDAVHQRIANWS